MAGLNHELSRELLWREFPASLAGTAFRQFWDVSGQPGDPEALADIPPISEWARRAAGRAPARRRRASSCCSCAASCCAATRRPRSTPPARRPPARSTPTTRLAPMFRGALAPDIVFVGFALSEESALGIDPAGPGWYFVFEEYPGEPRFGFDEVAAPGVPRTRGRARLGARAGHGLRPRRRLQAAAVRRRQPAGRLGPERGRHGVADVPAAVPRRDARVAPARRGAAHDRPRGDRRGARPRAGGRGRRARARRPARRRQGRPRAPARRPRAAARAHRRAAAGASPRRRHAWPRRRRPATRWPRRRAPPRPPRPPRKPPPTAADEAVERARQDARRAHAGGRRAPARSARARRGSACSTPSARRSRRASRRTRRAAPPTRSAAPLAAADAELQAAQAELAAASAQLAAANAQLADARNRQAAVEALPGKLSSRHRRAAHARHHGVAAVGRAARRRPRRDRGGGAGRLRASPAATAELERLRAELVAGENPDDLAALVATELPLALLPVRLETRFDAGQPARADLSRQRSTSTRTSRS